MTDSLCNGVPPHERAAAWARWLRDPDRSHNPNAYELIAELLDTLAVQAIPLPVPSGQPYGIVDPDYARVFTQARIIAWQYGYACVMHGSFTRDLDLLLVPWTVQAGDNHEQLLKLIAESCNLRFIDGKNEVYESTVDFTEKPHGRKSCSLFFKGFGDRRWVDISVVPRVPRP